MKNIVLFPVPPMLGLHFINDESCLDIERSLRQLTVILSTIVVERTKMSKLVLD